MAAGTPAIYHPKASQTNIPTTSVQQWVKSPYSGTGTQREVEWQIAENSGFTTGLINVSRGLRENDDHRIGDDWIDVYPEMLPLKQGTTYYIRCRVQNTSDETSSWSATVTVTTETRLTATIWATGQ